MGRNFDRGLEDRNEKDRYNDSKKGSSTDKERKKREKSYMITLDNK